MGCKSIMRTDSRRNGQEDRRRKDKQTNGRQTNGQMDERTNGALKKMRVLYHCSIYRRYTMTLYTRFKYEISTVREAMK